MKKYDVTALGELLIDFTDAGVNEHGSSVFAANPGGAPCNVLAMLTRLGHRTSFIGKVGCDIFGIKLKETLGTLGINTDGLVTDTEVRTTLAFVKNDKDGERRFSFYRNPGADMMLRSDEINTELISSSRIFHFGTLSMTHADVRAATRSAVDAAKRSGAIISFDPNLREMLWDSLEEAAVQTEYGLSVCDVLKISDSELEWFTSQKDFDKGIELLQKKYRIPLILLSMGRNGSRAYYKNIRAEAPAFIREDTVDTTGAGDTFFGCCLHYVLSAGIDNFTALSLEQMLTFANAAASIVTASHGALCVMPEKEEILKLATKKRNRQ